MHKLVLTLCLFSIILAVQGCHYSCKNCTADSYFNCSSCNMGTFFQMHDIDSQSVALFSPHRYIGICQTSQDVFNPLGVVLLAFSTIYYILSWRRNALVLINSLQTIALLSLLSIYQIPPLSYILSALQYFLLFLKTTSPGQNSTSTVLLYNSRNNIQNLLGSSDFIENVKVMDAIITFLIFCVFIVPIYVQIKNRLTSPQKPSELNEEGNARNDNNDNNNAQSCEAPKKANEQQQPIVDIFFNRHFRYFKHLVALFFYFLLCQNFIAITVHLSIGPINITSIIGIAFYLFLCVYFFVYTYYRPIPFFRLKLLNFFNYAKKILLPLVAVLAPQSLALPIMIIICAILESIYDYKFNKMANKLVLFARGLEGVAAIQFLIFMTFDSKSDINQGSSLMSIVFTASVCVLSSLLLVDFALYIKERFFENKISAVNTTMTTESNVQKRTIAGQNLLTESQFEQVSQLPLNNVSDLGRYPTKPANLTIELDDQIVADQAPKHSRNETRPTHLLINDKSQDIPGGNQIDGIEDQIHIEIGSKSVRGSSSSRNNDRKESGEAKDAKDDNNEFEAADRESANKDRSTELNTRERSAVTSVMEVMSPQRRRLRDKHKEAQLKGAYGLKK